MFKQSKRRSKYKSIKTVIDGFVFDSKKESEYYIKLKLLKNNGLIQSFSMQLKMNYEIHYTANERIYKRKGFYKCDFVVVYNSGEVEYIDVKGFRTPEYKRKKKIIENLYQIKIIEK